MQAGKKIYFASDLHLGVPNHAASRKRELHFCTWLDKISVDAEELHLMGDIFDFWFEYKHAIPRGYVRLLGKLAQLSDSGLKIYWYIGNHDMWIFDYIPSELGVEMIYEPVIRDYSGKRFYLAHGDGLGPGDHGYKFIKKVFRNKVCQWLFARLHPNFGIGVANFFSKSSRDAETSEEREFLGEENEWLAIHSKEVLAKQHVDFFIYGHRHLPLDIKVGDKSRYVNLGDWISHFSYASYDGEQLTLEYFPIAD